jgi:hypothetical protein
MSARLGTVRQAAGVPQASGPRASAQRSRADLISGGPGNSADAGPLNNSFSLCPASDPEGGPERSIVEATDRSKAPAHRVIFGLNARTGPAGLEPATPGFGDSGAIARKPA